MFIDKNASGDSGCPPADSAAQSSSNEESVKMTVIGIQKAVDRMVHLLHRHNIIAASDWSRPIAIKNTNEVMRVADRKIHID